MKKAIVAAFKSSMHGITDTYHLFIRFLRFQRQCRHAAGYTLRLRAHAISLLLRCHVDFDAGAAPGRWLREAVRHSHARQLA